MLLSRNLRCYSSPSKADSDGTAYRLSRPTEVTELLEH